MCYFNILKFICKDNAEIIVVKWFDELKDSFNATTTDIIYLWKFR